MAASCLAAGLAAVAVALAADYAPLWLLADRTYVAAAVDTLLHGCVSAAAWSAGAGIGAGEGAAAGASGRHSIWLSAAVVALVSSGLDTDHFIESAIRGGGFTFRGAMSLPQRPFGHSVAFLLAATAVGYAAGRLTRLPWLGPAVLVALATHQLRDAVKRGLWMPGVGSTRQLPYGLYLLVMAAVPVLLRHALLPPSTTSPRGSRAPAPPLLPV